MALCCGDKEAGREAGESGWDGTPDIGEMGLPFVRADRDRHTTGMGGF
jgi:hypothetical protein